MEKVLISKSIHINAPQEKVWEALLEDKYNRLWYAAFSEGTHAITDWKVGSKTLFIDNTGSGLVGKVVANKPYELLSIEHQGWVEKGVEDYDSEMARSLNGYIETYKLSNKNGSTILSIECDTSDSYADMMSESWDKALEILKSLSESR